MLNNKLPKNVEPIVEPIDEIPGIFALVKESYEKFKQGWLKLLLLSALPTISTIILGFIFVIILGASFTGILLGSGNLISSLISNLRVIIPVIVLLMIIFGLIQSWIQIAMLYLVSNPAKIDLKQAFSQTRNKILKFWWVTTLYSLIFMGGLTVLIIPGIILGLWLSLAPFILIFEEEGGLKALIKSREYARNRAWQIFTRYLGGFVLLFLTMFALNAIREALNGILLASLVEFATRLIYFPAISLYGYLIYAYSRRIKPIKTFTPKLKQKIIYILWSVLGIAAFIIIPLMTVKSIGTMIKDFGGFTQTEEVKQLMQEFALDAELEFNFE